MIEHEVFSYDVPEDILEIYQKELGRLFIANLYKKQSGICPLTDNTITEWNNTSKYHVDHKIPISKWLIELHGMNPNDISNLQLVEKTANLKKSNFF